MGTPDFAVPSLIEVNKHYNISAVVTVPDKPKGRGRKLQASPVKQKALELGIPVLQPQSLKEEEFVNEIKSIAPDIIIVIAFRILPRAVFSIPKLGTFNVHGSLLPKYRGAAPINWAIINGDNVTGLTSFLLDDKVDTGNILLNVKENINPNDTAGDLHDRLMMIAPKLTVDTVELLLSGDFTPEKQDESKATPAPKLFRDQLKIDFSKSALEVKNLINGTSPIPGSWTVFNGKRLKVLRAKLSDKKLKPGEYNISQDNFMIGCNDASISVLELQAEGKKAVGFDDFIKGYRGNPEGFTE